RRGGAERWLAVAEDVVAVRVVVGADGLAQRGVEVGRGHEVARDVVVRIAARRSPAKRNASSTAASSGSAGACRSLRTSAACSPQEVAASATAATRPRYAR